MDKVLQSWRLQQGKLWLRTCQRQTEPDILKWKGQVSISNKLLQEGSRSSMN